ncbi:MAG TPA: N-acetylmuramoyl-L-alanine amidase-like domain-containing protein [Prolixibacteraceae bacterium]|nr:N-acetylmuramoyl-L-alanine amidase-like domain-containing protein [Prolixibacteraceae bacterium]
MQSISYIPLLIVLLSCSGAKTTKKEEHNSINNNADSVRVVQVLNRFSEHEIYPLDSLAREFINTPYAAHTLENGQDENLVINLHQFDCTTFVETCLALKQTLNLPEATFKNYARQLKNIRYRNGELNGYTSRLHYFSEWIANNIEKGYVKDVTSKYGSIPYQKEINFMSTHPDAYPQLKADTTLIKHIIEAEEQLSNQTFYYIPKEEIASIENEIESGLIVAFTTHIDGLDVVHNGITTKKNGKTYMIHASSDAGKVVVTEKTLSGYIMQKRIQSGIILLKPTIQK